ncbi:glycosyltransferase family 4 protein [Nostoc ellipsosporum NOK]|nr:glycosyltransferase family 4 protein [Nostoc ellipsosporum NOK]
MPGTFEHILFVGPDYKHHRGGIGAVLAIYAKHIRPFKFIPTLSYRHKLIEAFFFTGALLRLTGTLLTDRNIRIVHVHGAKDGSIFRKAFVVFISKKIFRKKLVFHIHAGAFDERYNGGNKIYRGLCRFVVNQSDKLVLLSAQWNDFFNKHFHPKEIAVIPNPVEQKATQPPVSSSLTRFLFLGRIADHKGIFDLLRLINSQQEQWKDKCHFSVGGNHETERLQNTIRENGTGQLVEYIGWVEGNDKEKQFHDCHYFILPTYEEAMPMTLLEAFSYGRAALTTPVGSIPEIMQDGCEGWLFKPGDTDTLRELINQALDNPDQAVQLGNNALQRARHFYPEAIRHQLETLYQSLAK